ncbi:MAG: universal stress protein [Deltaproteobacteria bacterium]|nr:universal stress protein [Deltaproteobacteria bacterium]
MDILAPLDGSKRSEAILPHVEEMAKKFDAKVFFLRVEEPPLTLDFDEVVDLSKCNEEFNQRKDRAEYYLTERQKEFHKKGIEAETRITFGSVVKEILNTAKNINADIIAMASHGITGLTRTFYGSVAAGVLQRIDRPLFLIRSRRIE